MFKHQPIKITTWFSGSDRVTSLEGINGRSIQMLLRGENDSKQSDEFQASFNIDFAYFGLCYVVCYIVNT